MMEVESIWSFCGVYIAEIVVIDFYRAMVFGRTCFPCQQILNPVLSDFQVCEHLSCKIYVYATNHQLQRYYMLPTDETRQISFNGIFNLEDAKMVDSVKSFRITHSISQFSQIHVLAQILKVFMF